MRVQREQESKSPFVFVSERGTPFSTRGFQAMVGRAACTAGFDMKIHPHMLRHSCGFKLANDGSIPEPSRAIWATNRFSILSDTPNWHLRGSRAYSETERHPRGNVANLRALPAWPDGLALSIHVDLAI